jgi:hypothetical protein
MLLQILLPSAIPAPVHVIAIDASPVETEGAQQRGAGSVPQPITSDTRDDAYDVTEGP